MSLRMIDLFAGMGGIRIAFENHGVECVASSEIDKYACETYFSNFNEQPLGDVTKITGEDLPEFDILTAGFPCQPFSLGGLRKGFEDTRGTLFFEVARLLKECQPMAFLLENVAGLVSHDSGNTLKVIEATLTDLGYDFRWKLMNAMDYGVPQNRNRWYCVGFRKDLGISFSDAKEDSIAKGIFQFPPKCALEYTLSDILSPNDLQDYKISDTCVRNIDKYIVEFKSSERYDESKVLIANEIRASRCNFRNDDISPCLTAKMGTGGNNVPVVVKEKRKLTEQECLKIMGFPDWYKIKPNNMHTYKQLGNSVVVLVVDKIAKRMVEALK